MKLEEFKNLIINMKKNGYTEDEIIENIFCACWELHFSFDSTFHIYRFVRNILNNKVEEAFIEGEKIKKEDLDKIYDLYYPKIEIKGLNNELKIS